MYQGDLTNGHMWSMYFVEEKISLLQLHQHVAYSHLINLIFMKVALHLILFNYNPQYFV